MIRVFKHYIPHAVVLLGLFDLLLLMAAGEAAWHLRARQIAMELGPVTDRLWGHVGFAGMMLTAMISVGVYGADLAAFDAFRLRATARCGVARHHRALLRRLHACGPYLLAIDPGLRHGAGDRPAGREPPGRRRSARLRGLPPPRAGARSRRACAAPARARRPAGEAALPSSAISV